MVDTTLVAVIAAAVPSAVIGLVAWSIRSWFDEIRTVVKEVNAKVGGHGEKLAQHDERIKVLERERDEYLPRRRRG